MKFLSILCTVAAASLLLGAGTVQAAPCTVTSSLTDPDASLIHATSCGLGNSNNDNDSGLIDTATSRPDGTWFFLDKDENEGSGSTGLLYSDAEDGNSSGVWSIFSDASYDEYLIVVKSGAITGSDAKWAWFIIDTSIGCDGGAGAAFCGTWSTYNNKDISHLSLYGANGGGGGVTNVPEPISLALLGTGIMGMAFIRRRK